MSYDPHVCEFCLQEPTACDCDRSEGGGHWIKLSEALRKRKDAQREIAGRGTKKEPAA
jgi:hypothetical protein